MVELQEDTGVDTERNNKISFSSEVQKNNMIARRESEVDVDFQRVQSENELHKVEDDSIELGVIGNGGGIIS